MPYLFVTLMLALLGAPVTALSEDALRVDLQMENIFFRSGSNMVHGFLYKPQGKGPFPAILFNQATRDPYYLPEGLYPFESLAKWCTSHSYILFIPDRPGHETFGRQLGEFAQLLDDSSNLSTTNRSFLEGFDLIGKDVAAAVSWMTNQSYVDSKKIAMIGHSTGAMQTLLLATKKSPVRGFVAFSPAAKIWKDNKMIRNLLGNAVRQAREPLFLLQPQNDFNLGPSEELGAKLKEISSANLVKVYPAFGKTPGEAVMFGVHGSAIWGDDVVSFLEGVWK
jgi:dienelactone hydrolase